MFTQDELEKMPEAICRRLSGANRDFLQKIGEHILKIGTILPTDMHALEQMRLFGADVAALENELAAITKKNLSEIDTIFENTARENYDFSEQFFKYKGLDFVPYDKNTALKNMVRALAKQTKDTYKNYANHTAFMVYDGANRKVMSSLSEVYSFVTDKAVLAVRTGAVDYKSAMRKTLKDLADSGIRSVYRENGRAGAVADYANGYSRRLDTAVRQNILWGVKNCNQLTADFTGNAFGADGYEIDWHAGARPSHRAMGGKQYAIGRARTVGGIYYPSFDTVAPLLEDYGCLHFKFSILLGVSAPTYSNRELKRLKAADNRKITFEGKEYTVHEATQIQRQLETKARHAKDRQIIAKAAGDETLMRTEQERINLITRKYKAFSDTAGLPVKTERMSVSGYHRVKTNAELTTSRKHDKINNAGTLRIPEIPSSTISKKIKDGEFSVNLSVQQYNKHVEGTPQFEQYKNTRLNKGANPQSVLTIDKDEVQSLIIKKAGTGIVRTDSKGNPKPQESVSCGKIIGKYYGNGAYHETTKATIHYGKKAAHMVPIRGDDFD